MAYTRLAHAQPGPQREQALITRASHGWLALTKRRGAHRVPDFTDDIVGARGVVGWGTQAAELYPLAPSSAAAALAVAAHGGIGGHEVKWYAAALTQD
jgi:hypothetical protein